jgi:hypothetical protein
MGLLVDGGVLLKKYFHYDEVDVTGCHWMGEKLQDAVPVARWQHHEQEIVRARKSRLIKN